MIIQGFLSALHPLSLLLIACGVVVGITFGAMPGLSSTMAVALFLPLTYGLSDKMAMSLLMALYIGGISGGLITACLLKIPGTPSSVATCWDGNPMVERGEAMKALGTGVVFSFLGTIFSIVILIFASPALARLATNFGFYEYFAIALFSMSMIACMCSNNLKKGMIAGVLGFMVSTVGIAPIDAAKRFTFGTSALQGGFSTLPVLIGLFAMTEIFAIAATSKVGKKATVLHVSMKGVKGFGFSLKEFWSMKWVALQSALLGTGIGILPGIGGGTSNILAYTVAKNTSKHPEKFGTGIMDGIVASETSNNASIGGAMVPLLALGIPGDTVTAILLGALTMHGINPGPLLFEKSGELVYCIFAAMIVSSVIMLIFEFYGLKVFLLMLRIPKYMLMPIVFVLCAVGAYGNSSRIFDVYAILIFGLIGLFFSFYNIPSAPFILGFIIGPLLESNLRRGLQLTNGSFMPFLKSPIAVLFLLITLGTIGYTAFKELRPKKKKAD